MRIRLLLSLTLLLLPAATLAGASAGSGSAATASPAADPFDPYFTDRTMRVDYYHTGGLGTEIVSLDRVVADGPWPGSRTRLVDPTNLGTYLFEVIDPATNRVIYSRGFSSIFAEWVTTAEARMMHRTFHESLRFPWPKAPVQIVLKRREPEGFFREVWSTIVDPASPAVIAADPVPRGRVWTVFENGPAAEKVDLLILGDGYTEQEIEKFHADVRRLVGVLFETEPFRSRKQDFNVRAIDLPSAESGVNRPQAGRFRRTPLGAEYNIFGSERYILTLDNRTLRDVAAAAPYEFVHILVNDAQYGGGGIHNAQATVAVGSEYADYVFVHEFGHHFAALGDEYYTSDVAYETDDAVLHEPWEPNITALHDPARLKWRDLVTPGTPLPTPWDKEAFEEYERRIRERRAELIAKGASEEDFDRLFREQAARETALLGSMKYSGHVGAFEGASYRARGLYRPEADCIMFTRDPVGFCAVCRRAIERIIDLYARP